MPIQLSSDQVWQVIEKELFAVLGMVSKNNQARTVGIVYLVKDRKLYIGTDRDTWKTRHVAGNPHISLTVTVAKRIPFMPWIKIPAATITFPGTARILLPEDSPPEILKLVFRDISVQPEKMVKFSIIEVTPEKEFVTYGIGISLMDMRFPEKSYGRAPVG